MKWIDSERLCVFVCSDYNGFLLSFANWSRSFGKVYTVFSVKSVFISGIVIFEFGSLLCTLATSSKMFIVGRAIAGLGSSAMGTGMVKMLRHLFPMSKQAFWGGVVGGIQSIGLVAAPVIGGVLIDAFSWRACFGINLPLGAFCIAFTFYGFHDPVPNPETALPLWEKIKRTNPLGTLLIVPALTCFLMALQWGGSTYEWSNWRIILMLVVFGIMFSAFGYLQFRQGEEATLPIRIIKQRSVLGGLWFSACCNAALAVTENYISIYFQGVRGYTATKSGLLGVPMVGGLLIAIPLAATGTTNFGYYFRESLLYIACPILHQTLAFMYATSILAPIASGLLTTIKLDENIIKVSFLLGFLGAAIGFGIQGPQLGVTASLSIEDLSLGTAVITFGAGMGSALFVSASATLFNNRLIDELKEYSPSTNGTAVADAGLSGIRGYIGTEKLGAVLSGYNQAVVQTLYMPLALGLLTIVGTVAMERRSIKKKQS
jgi:MFS family permease